MKAEYKKGNTAPLLAWKRKHNAKYRAKNREKLSTDYRNYYKVKKRIQPWKGTRNGFTKEVFEARLAAQNNRCRICKRDLRETKPCGDHDHKTMQPRGILCNSCNSVLGFAKDNPEILREAAYYLDLWSLV